MFPVYGTYFADLKQTKKLKFSKGYRFFSYIYFYKIENIKKIRREIMKRKLSFLIAAFLLAAPTSSFAKEKKSDVNVEAESAILIDADQNKVLYEYNADKLLPPASLTKVMTLFIINDEIKAGKLKWDTMVKISKNAWQTGGSRMFIQEGKEISVKELVKGIAIVSGNDAAVAMAEKISGSTDKFVEKMNKKANELGMKNTKFTTVNGLSHTDVTTARDLGILTYNYIHNYPNMLSIHKTKEFTFNGIKQSNGNPMLYSYKGADGLKTGFVETNYNLIATAKRDSKRLISVSLDSKTIGQRFRTNRDLMDYGFSQFKEVKVGNKGEVVKNLRVFKAKGVDHVKVKLASDLSYAVNKNQTSNTKVNIKLPDYLEGGMKKGTVVGKEVVKVGNKTVSSDIILTKDLERAGFFKRFFDSIAMIFH
jgi:D-alanyl-D-alanine carboxypeptidase (penicillin-binding protein 5/6)